MDFPVLLSLVSTTAIVCSVVFAGLQIRNAQNQRSREAQLLLVRSFQTPEFINAMGVLLTLPEGLSKKELEERLGDKSGLLLFWSGTMESLGILVYRREITMDLIDDYFSGPIVFGWRRLRRYMDDVRKESGRETMGEWFQWLAERLQERESKTPPVPANIAYRHWSE